MYYLSKGTTSCCDVKNVQSIFRFKKYVIVVLRSSHKKQGMRCREN